MATLGHLLLRRASPTSRAGVRSGVASVRRREQSGAAAAFRGAGSVTESSSKLRGLEQWRGISSTARGESPPFLPASYSNDDGLQTVDLRRFKITSATA